MSEFASGVVAVVKILEVSYLIHAADKQTASLLTTTRLVDNDIKHARKMLRTHSTAISPHVLSWMYEKIGGAEEALKCVQKLVERTRVKKASDVHRGKESIGFSNRVVWVLKDGPKVQETFRSLQVCHGALMTVLVDLHAAERDAVRSEQERNNMPTINLGVGITPVFDVRPGESFDDVQTGLKDLALTPSNDSLSPHSVDPELEYLQSSRELRRKRSSLANDALSRTSTATSGSSLFPEGISPLSGPVSPASSIGISVGGFFSDAPPSYKSSVGQPGYADAQLVASPTDTLGSPAAARDADLPIPVETSASFAHQTPTFDMFPSTVSSNSDVPSSIKLPPHPAHLVSHRMGNAAPSSTHSRTASHSSVPSPAPLRATAMSPPPSHSSTPSLATRHSSVPSPAPSHAGAISPAPSHAGAKSPAPSHNGAMSPPPPHNGAMSPPPSHTGAPLPAPSQAARHRYSLPASAMPSFSQVQAQGYRPFHPSRANSEFTRAPSVVRPRTSSIPSQASEHHIPPTPIPYEEKPPPKPSAPLPYPVSDDYSESFAQHLNQQQERYQRRRESAQPQQQVFTHNISLPSSLVAGRQQQQNSQGMMLNFSFGGPGQHPGGQGGQ